MPLITKLRESIDSSDGSAFLKVLKFLMRSRQDYATPESPATPTSPESPATPTSPESPATPTSPESPAPFIRNLVLQGGGAKGAAYSGLIQALEEECILQHIETFVGSSAGAISAFILALGFNAKEFADIINQHNLQDLFDYIPTEDSTFSPVTAIAQCAITLTNGYVYSGDNALNFFEMLCQEILGNPRATFEDLEKQKASNPKLRSLIVTATKVNTLGGFEKKERYGSELFSFKHSKDVVIADAIRASMSIPVVYRNHTVKNSNDETVGTFADGGIYNNFAIQVLDEQEYMDPSYNMFGINHSTLGATLVSKLDPHITKVPVPKLLEHKKTKTSPVPVQTPPQSEASNANSIISAVLTGLKIKMKMDGITTSQPEDLADKTQQYRHRVIQIDNAGVSPVDFATAKKALLHSHGYTATISTIHTHLDPRQHDQNQSRKLLGIEEVRDDRNGVLTRLLTEFIIEFNKYKDVPISPLYNKADITENVRLRYVAHQILHNIKPTEDELQISLSKVLTTLTNASTVDSAIQARYQGVTDDTMITRKLFSLLTTVPYDDETFKRFLNGQFSRGMHFIQKKQTATEFNLLQTAVQIQNIQAVGTILRYIEITHKQLTQQTRSVKALQEVIHDCQPSLLNIARSNEQQEMVDLLQKLALDTSLPTRVAFEPDQAIKEEAQRLYGALETSLPPTSEMKGQLITLFNHPDADASNLLHRAIHENNLDTENSPKNQKS
jgi:hypothetical protein